MITIEHVTENIMRVKVPKTLKAEDFARFAPQVEEAIRQYGKIRLLVDASEFDGWENMKAFEKHVGFVKSHHASVERGALIVNHAWQHWVAGAFKIFVRTEIRIFDKGDAADAREWITH